MNFWGREHSRVLKSSVICLLFISLANPPAALFLFLSSLNPWGERTSQVYYPLCERELPLVLNFKLQGAPGLSTAWRLVAFHPFSVPSAFSPLREGSRSQPQDRKSSQGTASPEDANRSIFPLVTTNYCELIFPENDLYWLLVSFPRFKVEGEKPADV